MKTFSIGIIDDQQLFAHGIKSLLETFDFIKDVTICDIPNERGYNLPREDYDLLLIDILMPFMEGYEVFEYIKKLRPFQRIAFMSVRQDVAGLERAQKLGAEGFIFKSANRDALLVAMKTFLQNKKPYFMQRTAVKTNTFYFQDGKTLTIGPRELVFLELLIQEHTTKVIADKMGVSVHTVTGYRKIFLQNLK